MAPVRPIKPEEKYEPVMLAVSKARAMLWRTAPA